MTRTYVLGAVGAVGAVAAAGILMAQGFPALRFAQQFDRAATYLNLSADQKAEQLREFLRPAWGRAVGVRMP